MKTTPARVPVWIASLVLPLLSILCAWLGSRRAAFSLSAPDVCQAGEDVVCRLNVRHAPYFADAAGTLAIAHLLTEETASLDFPANQSLTLPPLSSGAVTLTLAKSRDSRHFQGCAVFLFREKPHLRWSFFPGFLTRMFFWTKALLPSAKVRLRRSCPAFFRVRTRPLFANTDPGTPSAGFTGSCRAKWTKPCFAKPTSRLPWASF